MYATISDLINDLLGTSFHWPIQTFGFFMALSFMAAYQLSVIELKRKEGEGLLHPIMKDVEENVPITWVDYATNMFIMALIFFKVFEMVIDYDALVENPQAFLLSAKGNVIGALAGAAYGYYTKMKEANALKGKQRNTVSKAMHPYQHMGNIVGIAAVAGLLGAKIFHNLENLDEFSADPIGSLLSFSGLTFYGGLIVGSSCVIYYAIKQKIALLHLMDATAVGLMLAYGVGRIGCHLSGDGDWGIANLAAQPDWLSFLPKWMWAFNYPHNVLSEGIPIPNCEGLHCAMLPNPVYPTPFYESVVCILLAGMLWMVRKRFKVPGTFFFFYLFFNGFERFFIEKIRVNSVYHLFGKSITQAEIISSVLILTAIVGYAILKNKARRRTV